MSRVVIGIHWIRMEALLYIRERVAGSKHRGLGHKALHRLDLPDISDSRYPQQARDKLERKAPTELVLGSGSNPSGVGDSSLIA